MVSLIVAVADNGVIGDGADIPWHLPADFAHFKATTMGGVLIMGRTTHEAIGRVLPGRSTIVLTRDPAWQEPGVSVAHSLDAALALAETLPGEAFIAGGGQVYAAAWPVVSMAIVTRVHAAPEGSVRLVEPDWSQWQLDHAVEHAAEVVDEAVSRPAFTIEWWSRPLG